MASTDKLTARLRTVAGEPRMIGVDRSPEFAGRLTGFVVRVGSKWALMTQSSDGGFFNGWVAFRLRDVKRIRVDTTFQAAFATTQPEWPPADRPDVGLDSTKEVLTGLGKDGALIGIQEEQERSALWIGRLDEVRTRWVFLHEVGPDARWRDAPLGYRLKSITTVELGTRYLTALGAVAGPGPGSLDGRPVQPA